VAALTAVGVLVGASLGLAPGAAAREPLTDHSVRVTVLRVEPSTPARSSSPQPLTVELRLTNTTDQSFDKLAVKGERGNPISSQQALDDAIAQPKPPDPDQAATFSTKQPVTASLGPRSSSTVEFASTSSSTSGDATGLCICQNRIYPLYFTLHTTTPSGDDLVVGSGQTYIPAFGESKPQPVQVSWVWPIIDRPHRLTGDLVFTDDDLAVSITDGRLNRVLQVVETAGRVVAMTLLVDPALIDELAVMSAGPYQVQSGATLVPGFGTDAAQTWLKRLRAALDANPKITIAFTPPADPDVESLTRNGLAWTVGLSSAAQDRVTTALGGHPVSSDVSWPAGGALSGDTLDAIVRQGARTVILSDAALPGGAKLARAPNALAALQTPGGPVLAAVTSSRIQRYVASVLAVGGKGLADLPNLVAEVAIRAVADGTSSHYVVIVAPRAIDPSEVAGRAILATAHVYWSTPLPLGAASPPTVEPADHGQLVPPPAGSLALSPLTIAAAQNLSRVVPALTSMLSSADANTLLGSLPAAAQRAESTAWRTAPAAGLAYAEQLRRRISAIETGVHILKPSGGTYTLASRNSPLPVTIKNDLNVAVVVRVQVSSANGLPGFSASNVGQLRIPAGAKLPLHIPTQLDRTGRFVVQATLYTPSGDVQLGPTVLLKVHSTALGAIGVIITISAAAVLVLALLIRLVRRLRNPNPAPGTAPPLIAP